MATKKLTGKDISTADLLFAVADGETFAGLAKKLGLPSDSRALDGALQREKRAGRVRFERADRMWVRAAAQATLAKPKRGARAA